jgi:GNAT superfamily N-acetyltransferase
LSAADIRVVDPLCADALALLEAAALEARALYPDLIPADAPMPTNAPHAPGCVYLVAYDGARPVGMGALRPLPVASVEAPAPDTAEVRRMFVDAGYRRRGVGQHVLAALEQHAVALGYRRLVLETGYRQTPAIGLYERSGYRRIAPFGPHIGDPTSVCFEKRLS